MPINDKIQNIAHFFMQQKQWRREEARGARAPKMAEKKFLASKTEKSSTKKLIFKGKMSIFKAYAPPKRVFEKDTKKVSRFR